MAGTFAQPITIEEAVNKIKAGEYLIPNIQRKFEWDKDRICALFDSLVRKYPINSFMFWKINKEYFTKYKLYGFVSDYKVLFEEEGKEVKPASKLNSVTAVIDGQQRLNSLYIGLYGSYAEKKPSVHWPKQFDKTKMPPKYLCLNIAQPLSEDNDEQMKYDFQFLAKEALNDASRAHLFLVSKILDLELFVPGEETKLTRYISKYISDNYPDLSEAEKEFAEETLCSLYTAIRIDEYINFFEEKKQDLEYVLDVFIRTNSGGIPLTPANLLMSTITSKWPEARNEIDELVKIIRTDYWIHNDFIIKAAVVLMGMKARLQLSAINDEFAPKLKEKWDDIALAIKYAFQLLNSLGFDDKSLRAKNAVIPVAYYIYKNNSKSLHEKDEHNDIRLNIKKWISLVILNGQFGGQSDSVIEKTVEVIANNPTDNFPTEEIIASFSANPRKNLAIQSIQFIDDKIQVQKDESECTAILSLIFPEQRHDLKYDKDHLFPATAFEKKNLKEVEFLKNDAKLMDIYKNPKNWNSIANLHFLGYSDNRQKNDGSLEDWFNSLSDKEAYAKQKFIPKAQDGNYLVKFENFIDFIEKRAIMLRNQLLTNIGMSHIIPKDDALVVDED